MGFKFGSRLDPKAASAKGSDDSVAVEDTPLNRLRAGLGLQPSAPAISASAAIEAERVEPKISRPGEATSSEPQPLADVPSDTKPALAKPVEVKAPEAKVKPVEVKAAEAKPAEAKLAEAKPVDVKPVE